LVGVSGDDRDQSPFLRSLAVAELLARPFDARNQPRLNRGRSVLNAPRRPAVSVMKRLVSPRFSQKQTSEIQARAPLPPLRLELRRGHELLPQTRTPGLTRNLTILAHSLSGEFSEPAAETAAKTADNVSRLPVEFGEFGGRVRSAATNNCRSEGLCRKNLPWFGYGQVDDNSL
jgi:hypothetical protein